MGEGDLFVLLGSRSMQIVIYFVSNISRFVNPCPSFDMICKSFDLISRDCIPDTRLWISDASCCIE